VSSLETDEPTSVNPNSAEAIITQLEGEKTELEREVVQLKETCDRLKAELQQASQSKGNLQEEFVIEVHRKVGESKKDLFVKIVDLIGDITDPFRIKVKDGKAIDAFQ
jgi:chromosome segregation ATPase